MNSVIKQVISDIEKEVKYLLEENSRLRQQVAELSQAQASNLEVAKVHQLELEVQKLQVQIDIWQKEEISFTNRVNEIRRLIQEEISKQVLLPEKNLFDSKITQGQTNPKRKDITDTGLPPSSNNSTTKLNNGEEEVGYTPYIEVEKEFPYPEPKINQAKQSGSPLSPIPKADESSPPLHKGNKETPPVSDNQQSSQSFLINDFEKEEDPFGDEGSKLDDEDFFKENKK